MTVYHDKTALLPTPKRLQFTSGTFTLASDQWIQIASAPQALYLTARRFKERLAARNGLNLPIVADSFDPAKGITVTLDQCRPVTHPEGYTLEVCAHSIHIQATAPAGAFYGMSTLWQLIREYGLTLPCLKIRDHPDFPIRGVMLDISRFKVPTQETLFHLVDLLADLKINHLELYMENAFAYRQHPENLQRSGRLTGEEILALAAHCRERYVDLVPNQNCYGHLTDWLRQPQYRQLADCTEGGMFPDGPYPYPYSLNPTDPASVTFIEGLLEELLPYFSSQFVNIGFDETFDLGLGKSKPLCDIQGRPSVYMEFLEKVIGIVEKKERVALFWADTITRHNPDLASKIPQYAVALEWGYTADYPFAKRIRPLIDAGRSFILCPSTGTWLSLTGRSHQAEQNIRNAALTGFAYGAAGLLTTDWGDWGHWQPLSVSYSGFAMAAEQSWNAAVGKANQFERGLSLHVFGDGSGKMGRLVQEFGCLHSLAGGIANPESTYFAPLVDILWRPWRWENSEYHFDLDQIASVKDCIRDLLAEMKDVLLEAPDGAIIKREYALTGALLTLACDIILAGVMQQPRNPSMAGRLKELFSEHEIVWRKRNKTAGLAMSLEFLRPLYEYLSSGNKDVFDDIRRGPLVRYPC